MNMTNPDVKAKSLILAEQVQGWKSKMNISLVIPKMIRFEKKKKNLI